MKKRNQVTRIASFALACVLLLTVFPVASPPARAASAVAATSAPVTGIDARKLNFNDSWKFLLVSNSAVTDTTDRSAVAFDDSGWKDVTLPHDWSIYEAYGSGNSRRSQGYLPGGLGWYRKTFTLDSSYADKKVSIMFDGIVQVSEVYINGTKLGMQFLGYNTFDYDITPYIHTDGTANTIAVRVQAPGNIQRWYCGAGIYRNTYLIVTETTYVPTNGVFVTTPKEGLTPAWQSMTPINPTNAVVNVKTKVTNESGAANDYSVRSTIVNRQGETVVAPVASPAVNIVSGSTITAEQNIDLPNPKLWSVDSPNLYWLKTEVLQGSTVVDTVTTRFGVRYIEFDASKGFFLNGVHTKLNGMCEHGDLGSLGMEVYQAGIDRRIRKLKDMGVNAVRTAHNPVPPEYIEACDRLGMLVFEEAFDQWTTTKNSNDFGKYFTKSIDDGTTTVFTIANTASSITWNRPDLISNAEREMKAMVDRDKNAPSIFSWSAGNEIDQYGTASGIPLYNQIRAWVREIDTTRPVAAAPPSWSGTYETQRNLIPISDIYGFNYKTTQYATNHAAYPNSVIFGSETSSAWFSRGVYHIDSYGSNESTTTDRQYSEYPFGTHFELASVSLVNHRPDYVAGEFVWTGHAYLGEPQNMESYAVSSYYGSIDTAGFEKDIFYFYKSNWTTEPVLHLLPQNWNWTQGQQIPIILYTNMPNVEIYLNGTVIYSKKDWDVYTSSPAYIECGRFPFQAGTLKAVGYDASGKKIIEDVVYTAGAAASVRLSADRAFIGNDGTDIAYVEATIVDSAGNKVPDAAGKVTFSVSGGEILALDSGDPTSTEARRGVNSRNAFSGKALAIVRPTKGSVSDITVTATYAAGSGTVASNVVTIGSVTGASVDGTDIISTDGAEVTTGVGIRPMMPKSIRVTYSSGLLIETAVEEWVLDEVDITTEGDHIAYGHLAGDLGVAECVVHVKPIGAVADIDVNTLPTLAPPLPVFITIHYSDGTVGAAEVVWPAVDPSLYAAAGSTFNVVGSLGEITVTARVAVKEFDYAETVNLEAVVGKMPTFPDGVTVHFKDGTQDFVPVTWDPPATLVSGPGRFTVTGSILGSTTLAATAYVHVQYVVYLSDLDWSSFTGTAPTKDKTIVTGETLIARNDVNGASPTYDKGLATHAPMTATYNIADIGFVRFTSLVSLGEDYGRYAEGSVIFKVYLDGKLAYTSQPLNCYDMSPLIDLDVTGVKQFSIELTPYGDANPELFIGNWADAKFYSDESQEPVNLAQVYYVRKGMPGDLPNILINPTINSTKYYGKVYLSYNNPNLDAVNLLGKTVTAVATLPSGATTTVTVPVVVVPRSLKYFYDPGDTSATWANIKTLVEKDGWTMGNTSAWPANVTTGVNTGWYATSGSGTTVSTSATGVSTSTGLFTSLLYTTSNNSKIGFNFTGLTNGTSYTVYLGYYNPWASRTLTTWSSTTAVTGALGAPPYNASTGVSQGSNTANTTSAVRTFSVTPTASQIRVGIFCTGNQPMVSFAMLEENVATPSYTAALVKPAEGVVSYSAPFASGATAAVASGDRLFFNIVLEDGYEIIDVNVTNGATAEVVGNQIIVSNITADTTITPDVLLTGQPAITAFDFPTVEDEIVLINQLARTINVTVPYSTNVTSLSPTVRFIGESYEPTGALDFSAPKTYTVKNGDAVSQYTVTVTADPGADCDITSFAIDSREGVINGANIALTLALPYGTVVADVLPVVRTSIGASYAPASPVTFIPGTPVTYTVTSANGLNSKEYFVTVTVDPPVIAGLSPSQTTTLETTPEDGESLLPRRVEVVLESGQTVMADVTWGQATYTLNTAVTVIGVISYDGSAPISRTFHVDVVEKDAITAQASVKTESGFVIADFSVINMTSEDESAIAFIAQYAGDRLVQVWSESLDVAPLSRNAIGIDGIPFDADSVYRAFLWDVTTYIPLCAFTELFGTRYDNLALNVPARSTNAETANPVANAVDGNRTGTRWCTTASGYPRWIEVDLGSECRLEALNLYFEARTASTYYQYKVWGRSTPITNWSTPYATNKDFSADSEYFLFADKSDSTAVGYTAAALSGTARYIVIQITGTNDSGAWASIHSIEVSGWK
ncbi:MAG: NPCBM/NEW2 domain-containing protein [Oscillospiraceae bacterium]|jgi:beta-galactosidase|nr:NPCBM/NEW2 domain-containing protein [Oscillospiraceae bacterium]